VTGIRRLLDAALVTLIIVGLTTIVLGRVVPMTGRATLVVASGSMVPALPIGAAVIVQPVRPEQLVVGDIVSLRSGAEQAIFTHRITRLAERDGAVWVETKGDSNPAIDPSITPASAVMGRVVLVLPQAGFVIAWLSLPTGAISVIAAGLALMMASWLLAGGACPSSRAGVADRVGAGSLTHGV
jgi:signal peptidase I